MRWIVWMGMLCLVGCRVGTPASVPATEVLEWADKNYPCTTVQSVAEGTKTWSTPAKAGETRKWFCDPPCRCVEP